METREWSAAMIDKRATDKRATDTDTRATQHSAGCHINHQMTFSRMKANACLAGILERTDKGYSITRTAEIEILGS